MARVSKTVQEINLIMSEGDALAAYVTNLWTKWHGNKREWIEDMKELRNYIFQTDTTQTTNKKLPWKNKTSIPKITQIRDNLHANYMAALFPHDDWFKWEAESQKDADRKKARMIEAYMKQKIRESGFKTTIGELLYDYIDYGNAFGEVEYESETHTTADGVTVVDYNGPRVYRISPYDINFDITAPSFKKAAKISRNLVSLGSLKHAADKGSEWAKVALNKAIQLRKGLSSFTDSDIDKSNGIMIDGFGSLSNYYSSNMVEILTYEGDTFDIETGEVKTNRQIIVVDRKYVCSDQPINSWLGESNKEHAGWRFRPDNLWAMGPLDNLVGMQYRLDHLENLKADVFDQIAHPVLVLYGMVEDFEWGPGERIFADVDSKVDILRPDATALNADFQMDRLMQNMEELVGAPRQAMGIRTPGEKTAFEVQALENAAGRIFQQKIQYFEEHIVEPLLNQMLASARQNVNAIEVVKVLDDDFGVSEFLKLQPEDLKARGKLRPIGARHFARQAQLIQNLTSFVNSAAYADPAVSAHVSGLQIAKTYEEMLGLGKTEMVIENVRVAEQMNTQKMAARAQNAVGEDLANSAMQAQDQAIEAQILAEEQGV